MATIKEDYVSFEVAKLFKEKGFDEPCHCFYEYRKRLYNDMDKYFPDGMKNSDHDKEGNKAISAPTHQMAMKWLREIHNIMVSPYALSLNYYGLSLGYYFEIFDLTNGDSTGCKPLYKVGIPFKEDVLNTYEKAVEAGIKYALENLI